MMPLWTALHPRATVDMLGYIPTFLDTDDPRPAREQFDTNYVHGGWQSFGGFTMKPDGLHYPGDPPMKPIAETRLRDETIRLYECEWVAIIQPDGSYDIARMD